MRCIVAEVLEMAIGAVQEKATGLEDDENFFELVRQFSELGNQQAAARLTREVLGYVLAWLPPGERAGLLSELPIEIENDLVSSPAGFSEKISLQELERRLERSWQVDVERAARLAASVGLAVADRIGSSSLRRLRLALPHGLKPLFPDRLL